MDAKEIIRCVRSGELTNVKVHCAALCGHLPSLEALEDLESINFTLEETAEVFGLPVDEFREWVQLDCPGSEKEGFSLPRVQHWAMNTIWSIKTIPNCNQDTYSSDCSLDSIAKILGVSEATAAEWAESWVEPTDNKPVKHKARHVIDFLYNRRGKSGQKAKGIHDWFNNGPLVSMLTGLCRLDIQIARQSAVLFARINICPKKGGGYLERLSGIMDAIERWLLEPTQSVDDLLKSELSALSKKRLDKNYLSKEDTIAQSLLQIIFEDRPIESVKPLVDKCMSMRNLDTSLGSYDDEFSLLWNSSDAIIARLCGHQVPSVRPKLKAFVRWRIMVELGSAYGGFMEYEQDSFKILMDWQNETIFYKGKTHFSGDYSHSDGDLSGENRGVRNLTLSSDFKKLFIHYYDGKCEERSLPE